jgi:hypothetical protein
MPDPELLLSEEPEEELDEAFIIPLKLIAEFANSSETKDRIYLAALGQVQLLKEKNAKYKDAWKFWGIFGVIQDMIKKLQRLENLTWDRERKEWLMTAEEILNDLESEGNVYDTIRDICGYALLSLTLFEEALPWQYSKSIEALKSMIGATE